MISSARTVALTDAHREGPVGELMQFTQMSLLDLVPAEWRDEGSTSVWLRVYRAFRIDADELRAGAAPEERPADLRVIVQISSGFPYLRPGRLVLATETEWHLDISGETEHLPTGTYVVLMTPFASVGREGNEPQTVARMDAAAGALAAVSGRDAVFECVCEYELHLDGKMTMRGPAWQNPLAFQPPRLGARHGIVYALLSQIYAADTERRSKTELSLRWIESATRAGGVDGFLKYWIALETLAMTSYSDYSPVLRGLARAYGISTSAAGARFAIGRMFGLRGRILHAGRQPPIHGTLLQYMEAVYGDVLLDLFGLQPLYRAAEVLGDATFSLQDALNVGIE